MKLARLAALVLLLLPAQAWAFDWFGLRSGMTLDQVRAAAPAGSTLRLNGDFGFIEKDGAAVATVTFCKGRLIALSRTIDAQSDWFTLADKMIKQYGAPKVTPASDPWAGPNANVSKGLELSWRSGRNKYALTSYPSSGQPAGPRPGSAKTLASLSVADLGPVNACVARREAVHEPARSQAARPPVRKASFARREAHSKHERSKLPPIGGGKLDLALRGAARPAPAPTAPASRPHSAATADAVAAAAPTPIDPASARGRILRLFGALKTPTDARGATEDR